MEEELLKVENLWSGYKETNILKGINLVIKRGEFWGVAGPNGAGKTTLLKSITKILSPKRGKIFFKGKNIARMDARKLAQKVAVVPQFSIFWLSFTVKDFILLGRIPYLPRFYLERREDYEAVEEAMELTGTTHLQERRINELSGGEKQKVVIARSLAQKPEFLLLDEPVSHLDIKHQLEILNLIEKLNQKEKVTILMISHDLNLTSHYVSKLILMKEGKIFARGTPQEVITEDNIEKVYEIKVKVSSNGRKNPVISLW
ncbi:ABC transporter ATP-binding protein [Candidatus Aerophobetes bacterium]|nr:ABC transporter ATP-binding protein [Candidatus Aerophobetes bacterium]